jgi:hypothetical protein
MLPRPNENGLRGGICCVILDFHAIVVSPNASDSLQALTAKLRLDHTQCDYRFSAPAYGIGHGSSASL